MADANLIRRKLLVAGIMALCALGLTIADRTVAVGRAGTVNDFASAHGGSAPINAAIDAMLARYGIDGKAVNTWRVHTPEKKLLRVEQRLFVPPEFPSVKFNYELNARLLPLGGRVAATERTKEKVVTMHIMSDGVIIRTMAFAMRTQQPATGRAPAATSLRRAKH